MKSEILKCSKCNIYTLETACPDCYTKTQSNKPPKFSPEDKYGHYRRLYKNEMDDKKTKEFKV